MGKQCPAKTKRMTLDLFQKMVREIKSNPSPT